MKTVTDYNVEGLDSDRAKALSPNILGSLTDGNEKGTETCLCRHGTVDGPDEPVFVCNRTGVCLPSAPGFGSGRSDLYAS